MALPFFFAEEITPVSKEFVLNEESSKHVVQVLRMHPKDQLRLTDGKGNAYHAEITENHKKKCAVKILAVEAKPKPAREIAIAISLLKNSNRFEWFLEKATEIGVSHIIPLLCERTEKHHFRYERMKTILVSAMLQSQQAWLPLLDLPVLFNQFVTRAWGRQKYIAHCIDEKKQLIAGLNNDGTGQLILIGPEGDFTPVEVQEALHYNFIPVSLGETRLRTETAGVVSCVLLNNT